VASRALSPGVGDSSGSAGAAVSVGADAHAARNRARSMLKIDALINFGMGVLSIKPYQVLIVLFTSVEFKVSHTLIPTMRSEKQIQTIKLNHYSSVEESDLFRLIFS
jgi:hypothetical protein